MELLMTIDDLKDKVLEEARMCSWPRLAGQGGDWEIAEGEDAWEACVAFFHAAALTEALMSLKKLGCS
jgi:hypothetical protein